jgi:hypothetical protein
MKRRIIHAIMKLSNRSDCKVIQDMGTEKTWRNYRYFVKTGKYKITQKWKSCCVTDYLVTQPIPEDFRHLSCRGISCFLAVLPFLDLLFSGPSPRSLTCMSGGFQGELLFPHQS